jgi:uncharacterized membrane protein
MRSSLVLVFVIYASTGWPFTPITEAAAFLLPKKFLLSVSTALILLCSSLTLHTLVLS